MMGAPRTEDTKMLEPFKRQYFQWYCKDKYTQRRVKELFDILFEYLRIHEGTSYHATQVMPHQDLIGPRAYKCLPQLQPVDRSATRME